LWGQPPSAVRRPKGRLSWPALHGFALLDRSVISALNFRASGKAAARAVGQLKVAVSTEFFKSPQSIGALALMELARGL